MSSPDDKDEEDECEYNNEEEPPACFSAKNPHTLSEPASPVPPVCRKMSTFAARLKAKKEAAEENNGEDEDDCEEEGSDNVVQMTFFDEENNGEDEDEGEGEDEDEDARLHDPNSELCKLIEEKEESMRVYKDAKEKNCKELADIETKHAEENSAFERRHEAIAERKRKLDTAFDTNARRFCGMDGGSSQ
jgi:hypothetical protein